VPQNPPPGRGIRVIRRGCRCPVTGRWAAVGPRGLEPGCPTAGEADGETPSRVSCECELDDMPVMPDLEPRPSRHRRTGRDAGSAPSRGRAGGPWRSLAVRGLVPSMSSAVGAHVMSVSADPWGCAPVNTASQSRPDQVVRFRWNPQSPVTRFPDLRSSSHEFRTGRRLGCLLAAGSAQTPSHQAHSGP
jgi:hypothetical protein